MQKLKYNVIKFVYEIIYDYIYEKKRGDYKNGTTE